MFSFKDFKTVIGAFISSHLDFISEFVRLFCHSFSWCKIQLHTCEQNLKNCAILLDFNVIALVTSEI